MLWFALHLPHLSLEAFCATLPGARQTCPVALVAEHRITAVNELAAACGIQPGCKRATALALAADLVLGQADAERDAQALQAAAHAALAFTPAVTLEGPPGVADTVLLEVQASLRHFGGAPALLRRLRLALAPLGHQLQMASAPTALGAALLARLGRGQEGQEGLAQGPHSTRLPALQALLGGVPVGLLAPGHGQALQGMGLHTLADLRRLPRAGLARRFGQGLLDGLDRAFGRRPDPRTWVELAPTFDSRLELFARADSTEQVLQGAAVLLARLVAWAQARQARVGAFTLLMQHERPKDTATELHIELAEPAADAAHLQLLLRERLARCRLAAPTLELRIHCRQLAHSPAPNAELFPTRHSQDEGLVRLLERLRARLGDEQVQQLQPVADHRPERASRAVPAGLSAARAHAAPPSVERCAALPLHRPVWLLAQPQPLPEHRSQPLLDGRPLQLLCGPERIEAGWWDGALATRDYFIAQAMGGALVWIYRDRLPGTASSTTGWFLHGRFG